jgi:hypothetical protein
MENKMNFYHFYYVPCLRWKQGEYQAVLRLPAQIKEKFAPLIEIPEIGWDFEEEKDKKIIDEHLTDFAQKKIYRKWGTGFCFVDLNLIRSSERMADGNHPIHFVFDQLREAGCNAVPVTGLNRDNAYQKEVKNITIQDKSGICLRIKIDQAAKQSLKSELNSLLSRLKVKPEICDLIIDLGAPNFIPLKGFSKLIQAIMNSFPYLDDWRTFTLLGTSFPETMASIKKGGEIIPRYEWQLYKMLVSSFIEEQLRIPIFGDYVISHPSVLEVDMRVVKPSATIRYTSDNSWYIIKGENVKDEKFGKFKQYRDLCNKLMESKYYYGSGYSWGDHFIQECATISGSTGNLTSWRQVGTNHHIVKVIQDIASFYAS